jgi:hypothetical protein
MIVVVLWSFFVHPIAFCVTCISVDAIAWACCGTTKGQTLLSHTVFFGSAISIASWTTSHPVSSSDAWGDIGGDWLRTKARVALFCLSPLLFSAPYGVLNIIPTKPRNWIISWWMEHEVHDQDEMASQYIKYLSKRIVIGLIVFLVFFVLFSSCDVSGSSSSRQVIDSEFFRVVDAMCYHNNRTYNNTQLIHEVRRTARLSLSLWKRGDAEIAWVLRNVLDRVQLPCMCCSLERGMLRMDDSFNCTHWAAIDPIPYRRGEVIVRAMLNQTISIWKYYTSLFRTGFVENSDAQSS